MLSSLRMNEPRVPRLLEIKIYTEKKHRHKKASQSSMLRFET